MSRPKVLIASYLVPELVDYIRHQVPQVEVINHPELLGSTRHIADHSALPQRTPEQEAQWQTLLAEADILFDFDQTHHEDLPELAPKLKWIQATSAGIGQFVKNMDYAQRINWVYTTASGAHARPLAEFFLMVLLMFAKDYPYMEREKANRHWGRYHGEELAGKMLAIVGLGKIGRETARLAKAFDMRVIDRRRNLTESTPFVDTLYDLAQLDELLRQADYLVLATPHTNETETLIGVHELALLPPGTVFINIAHGAALDVFTVEPLPSDSPLWDIPNVIICPHSASTVITENQKIMDIFIHNLRCYLDGKPMQNVLDMERLY
jgi:glyoxylate/hydroxypyruvate reductase A